MGDRLTTDSQSIVFQLSKLGGGSSEPELLTHFHFFKFVIFQIPWKAVIMDLDEIMQVQEEIYCAEKEVTLLELELQRKVQCLVDLQRRELSLLERKQRPTPATED